MTTLLDRPPTGPSATAPPPGVLAALAGALRSAVLGLVFVTVVVLVAWAAEPDGSAGTPQAFRMAVTVWLAAHHTAFVIAGGHAVALVPLGLLLLPATLLYRSGALLGRQAGELRPAHGVRLVAALAAGYGLLVAVAAAGVAQPGLRPQPVTSLLWGAGLAAACAGAGLVQATGTGPALRALLPPLPRALLAGATVATAVLVAAGAGLAVATLVVHRSNAGQALGMYQTGVVGHAVLLLLGVLAAPNVAVWGAAYAAGPGFAVGIGTSVGPSGVDLGAIPALPWLDVLPGPGPSPALLGLVLLVPLLAGTLAGIVVARRIEVVSSEDAALHALLAGPLAGAMLAALAWVAGGSLGGGRLAAVGPSPWQVGLSVALEVAVAAGVAAWAEDRLRMRRAARRGAP